MNWHTPLFFLSSLIFASHHPPLDTSAPDIEVKSHEEGTIVNHASTSLLPLLYPIYHPQQTSTVSGSELRTIQAAYPRSTLHPSYYNQFGHTNSFVLLVQNFANGARTVHHGFLIVQPRDGLQDLSNPEDFKSETYRESLLRRIASGDTSFTQAAKLASAPELLPSTTRSSDLSAPAATQESRKTSLANHKSTDLDHDDAISPFNTTESPNIEFKFSKIVSIAFLIGPDLESKSGTSSSTKDAPVPVVKKTKDKQRKSDAVTDSEPAKQDRKSTQNAPARISVITTKNRESEIVIIPDTPDKVCKTAALPKADKETLKSGSRVFIPLKIPSFVNPFDGLNLGKSLRIPRLSSSTKQPYASGAIKRSDIDSTPKRLDLSNHSTSQLGLNDSTKDQDSDSPIETPTKISKVNDKKRKSETTTTSATVKKARTNPALPKPGETILQSKVNKLNTSKEAAFRRLLPPASRLRRKSNPVRKLQRISTRSPPRLTVLSADKAEDEDDDDD